MKPIEFLGSIPTTNSSVNTEASPAVSIGAPVSQIKGDKEQLIIQAIIQLQQYLH